MAIGEFIDEGRKILKTAVRQGADSAEVFIHNSSITDCSIEKNSINLASTTTDFGIGIRIIKSKKLGFAYCTSTDKVKDTIANAIKVSKLSSESEFDFAKPDKYPKVDKIYDKKLLRQTISLCIASIDEILTAALEVHPKMIIAGGGVGFGFENSTILNTNGVELETIGTILYGGASTLFEGKKTNSTGFEHEVSRVSDIDFENIGRKSAELALATQNPKKFKSKQLPVVFTPHGLSGLIEFTIAPALYGERVHKGESVYANCIGESVAVEALSLIDDGSLAGGLNSGASDDEGVPSQRIELVKNGILQNYLYDLTSGIQYNQKSTGNAVRSKSLGNSTSFRALPRTCSRNFIISGKSQKYSEIISEISDGILVHEVMGAHTSNPVSGDFSVNANISFEIKNGELKQALKPVMISGNMPEYLKKVTALGNDYRKLTGDLTPISTVLPSIKIENVRVTA